jgi:hypothetical protein
MEKTKKVEFSVTELALVFSALDYLLIEAECRQTAEVDKEQLRRIQNHLNANVGHVNLVETTEKLAKRLVHELEGAV